MFRETTLNVQYNIVSPGYADWQTAARMGYHKIDTKNLWVYMELMVCKLLGTTGNLEDPTAGGTESENPTPVTI